MRYRTEAGQLHRNEASIGSLRTIMMRRGRVDMYIHTVRRGGAATRTKHLKVPREKCRFESAGGCRKSTCRPLGSHRAKPLSPCRPRPLQSMLRWMCSVECSRVQPSSVERGRRAHTAHHRNQARIEYFIDYCRDILMPRSIRTHMSIRCLVPSKALERKLTCVRDYEKVLIASARIRPRFDVTSRSGYP